MQETQLLINNTVVFPQRSARGVKQMLELMSNKDQLLRTADGILHYNGDDKANHKYVTIISAKDTTAAALDDLYVGQELRLSCVTKICKSINIADLEPVPGTATEYKIMLSRPARPESIVIEGANMWDIIAIDGNELTLTRRDDEGDEGDERLYIHYQPILNMMVTGISYEHDEWGMQTTWRLALEEI